MQLMHKNMRWLLPLLSLLVLAASAYLLYTFSLFDLQTVITDSIISTGIFALSIWGILLIINAYPTQVIIITYSLVAAVFFSLAAVFADWLLLKFAISDFKYQDWLSDSLLIRYLLYVLTIGWTATNAAYRKQADTLKSKFRQQADAAALLKDAELYKLRQQLQPHFLYNSLNSISALTMIEPVKAQEMIGKLSDFLRSSVKREAKELIPIGDELDYIEAYLSIESIRFGDRLNVIFEKDYTDHASIPPFLLQPLLENAIKFGLYGKTGAVVIHVFIKYEEPYLVIKISNPYDSTGQPPKGTGFGLTGVKRRLYLLYARTDLLDTDKDEDIFTSTLKIPQSHV